ncbi:adenylosuccinate lyase [Candidatus Pacebacteria bacterium]|nr:adenylosuccinate lyase [Candidatus Paceibacterota bacterium]
MTYPISALDGRYKEKVSELSEICSEFGLSKYRVMVEVAWLLFLKDEGIIPVEIELPDLRQVADFFAAEDFHKIKTIEQTTNHDVKAVEYFLREHTKEEVWPWIHFAATSEDINNIAYALMLRDARAVMSESLLCIIDDTKMKAKEWKEIAMLSRTHGQSATPTTMGKELAVYWHRLCQIHERMMQVPMTAKCNGATGNFAAHTAAFPDVDWIELSQQFVTSLNLEWNPLTTQIESHDNQAALMHEIVRLSSVLSDLCTDVWGYISIGYFGQKTVEGEVGSSTMPHKVNPIDFENARGNFKLARGIASTLADELPISMWQRDLSDSTLQRNFGLVFGHFLLGLKSLQKGLGKIELKAEALARDLEDNPEVLTEAIQTVLRKNGHADAYEQLKALSRGKRVSLEEIRDFIKTLDIEEKDKENLLALTPAKYTGQSAKLVEEYLK